MERVYDFVHTVFKICLPRMHKTPTPRELGMVVYTCRDGEIEVQNQMTISEF